MSYVAIEDFKAGLDRRRMAVTSPAGSLLQCKDCHITRGGEAEKRRAMVSTYSVAQTFGMAAVGGNLYVFGSVAVPSPALPVGVLYQRLQHPAASAMVKIRSVTVMAGKFYVIAEFADGAVLHFYDGVEVTDWRSGIVKSYMVNVAGVATALAALVDGSDNYISTALASVVTITSQTNKAFTITGTAVDGGAVNDQTIAVATTQQAVEDVVEVLATGAFTVLGGVVSAGVNTIASVVVNAITITSAAVDYAATPELTAAAIAANINAFTSAPDYTATAVGGRVIISAKAGTGSTPNNFSVQVTVTGSVRVATGGFRISGGTASAGVNEIQSVKVNGVEIMSATDVDWATSNSVTATNLATNINGFTSTPDYKAYADGPDLFVFPLIATQSTPANLTLTVTVGGDVTIENATSVNTTVTAMSGGVAAATGQPQISTVTLGGTFDAGDKFTVTLVTGPDTEVFGYDRVSGQIATVALTHRSKVYVGAGPVAAFSGIKEPTKFNGPVTGAGLIDMSTEAAGSEAVTAFGVYQNNLAVFARRAIQIWAMDPDPDANAQLQVLPNIGTIAPNTVLSYGESDVFFLADTGIRSLRARAAVTNASVSDTGTPIDDLVAADYAALTEAQIADAFAIIDPNDGRYLCFIGDSVYVFTYFPTAKISAWSLYKPGFTASAAVTVDRKVYVRAGDTIYKYGGALGTDLDACGPIIELPFLSANTIATFKKWTALDVAVEGEWDVFAALNPNAPTEEIALGKVWEHTFQQQALKAIGKSPMFKLRFVGTGSAYGRIGSVVAHYEMEAAS